MIENWINAATILYYNDDPLRALQLLELLPAHLRLNPEPEIIELKRKIKAALVPTRAYADYTCDSLVEPDKALMHVAVLPRGRLAFDLVKHLNAEGLTPHILEVGPGTYWLPIGLHESNLNFKYTALGGNQSSRMQFTGSIGDKNASTYKDGPKVFIGYEIIEHMENPDALAWDAYAFFGSDPDALLISTPNGCFDNNNPKVHAFERGAQQHLRTYLMDELVNEVKRSFGHFYKPCVFLDQLINLLAINTNSPYTKTIEQTFK